MKEYFKVNVDQYDETKHFVVVRPSPLNQPKDNSVMFIMPEHISNWEAILKVKECLVFWPDSCEIPPELSAAHAVVLSDDPRYRFALFFRENNITYNPKPVPYEIVNGAYICEGASIGENCTVLPGAYIDSEAVIGNNCYIGSGVRIMGSVKIGNNCIVRENTVIGTDGLTTNRDENGKVVTIPQFGGVTIEDDVQIGANTVICKGAIDDTVIHTGCRIDNCCFISHNVQLGEDTMVVGETIMFGSTSTGKQAFISGNATIRDRKHIGEKAVIGMGSVVVKDVEDGAVVKGNPAK